MLDLSGVTGFEWDAGNARKSEDKHHVSQSEAEQTFFNDPILFLPDTKHSEQEARYHALGKTEDGRRLQITFTLRRGDTLIRVISARDMSRQERSIYERA